MPCCGAHLHRRCMFDRTIASKSDSHRCPSCKAVQFSEIYPSSTALAIIEHQIRTFIDGEVSRATAVGGSQAIGQKVMAAARNSIHYPAWLAQQPLFKLRLPVEKEQRWILRVFRDTYKGSLTLSQWINLGMSCRSSYASTTRAAYIQWEKNNKLLEDDTFVFNVKSMIDTLMVEPDEAKIWILNTSSPEPQDLRSIKFGEDHTAHLGAGEQTSIQLSMKDSTTVQITERGLGSLVRAQWKRGSNMIVFEDDRGWEVRILFDSDESD